MLPVTTLLFVGSSPHRLFSDFGKAYYPAGQDVLHGPAALAPDLTHGVLGFVNLPVVAYLFAPFGRLSLLPAGIIFTVLGLAAVFWAWRLLVEVAGLKGAGPWILLLLMLTSGPLIYSVKMGNLTHVILLPIVAGMVASIRGRPAWAGVLIGLAALIKLPLLLFGGYFLLRRDWRALMGFTSVGVVAGLLSLGLFGWQMDDNWFNAFVLNFGASSVAAFNVQSLQAFLERLGGVDLLSWSLEPVTEGQKLAGHMFAGVLVALAMFACRKPADDPVARTASEYSLVLALSVLISPLSWIHYYLLFLLPVAFFLASGSGWPRGRLETMASGIGLALIAPVICYGPVRVLETWRVYSTLIVSLPFFAGLVLFALMLHWRANLADGRVAPSAG